MKKLFLPLLFIPFFLLGQDAAEKGIHFEHGTFAELLAKAGKENKMIMIDAFTTWCGPCKWMAKNIFPNDTVADFYNKNFVCEKFDMEKGEGLDLAKKYQVSCYPTYLYIDAGGQLLHRQSGSMEAKEFIELGQNALNPAKQYASAKKKYDSGTATADEMAAYVLMRGRTCLPVKEEMAKYFATQPESELTNKRNWDILNECRMDIAAGSREFKYLADHKAEYDKLYTAEATDNLIKSCYSFALRNLIKENNTEGYDKFKEELLKKNLPFGEEMVLSSDLSLYKSKKDWARYAETAVKYVETYKKDDYNTLNSMAWNFYENISDKAMLAKAEGWAKHSVELSPGYFNYDTWAAVLYKLGKKPEAQAAAEKAIELAKKDGEDYKETEVMLEKIKAMQ